MSTYFILQAVSYAYLDFRTELVNLMIRQSRYRKKTVVPQSLSHSIRDSVLTVVKLAYREESVTHGLMLADVQFTTLPFPALFVKFISAQFPVLQALRGTELNVD